MDPDRSLLRYRGDTTKDPSIFPGAFGSTISGTISTEFLQL
jgi:hypothetical protein